MFEGKTAVITGGSQGIGKATALKLAASGANIVLVHMGSEEDAETACTQGIDAAKANGHDIRAKAIRMDVSDFAAVKETLTAIVEEFESIDVLVNCAGITRDGLIAMMKEENFDAVINVNLKGTFNMIRHCTPIFMKQRSGAIVNVSSVSGMIGNAGQANYSTSKAGVIGLTKSTA